MMEDLRGVRFTDTKELIEFTGTGPDPEMPLKVTGIKAWWRRVRIRIARWLVRSYGLNLYGRAEILGALEEVFGIQDFARRSGYLARHYKARTKIEDRVHAATSMLIAADDKGRPYLSVTKLHLARQEMMQMSKASLKRTLREHSARLAS